MASSDFLTWAAGAGANVMTQAAYAANPAQQDGVNDGIADPTLYNKQGRQSAFVTAAIAEYMMNVTQQNIVDDGNLLTFLSQFWQALLGNGWFIDSGVASALLVAAPFGLTFPAPITGLAVNVKAVAASTGPTTLNWMGTGNKNVVYSDGTPIAAGDIKLGSVVSLVFDGTNWQCGVLKGSVRTKVAAAPTFFVNAATGSDVTGDGSSGNPWHTLQFAYNFLLGNLDAAGNVVEIELQASAAAETGGLIVTAPIPSCPSIVLNLLGDVAVSSIVTSISAQQSGAFLRLTGSGNITNNYPGGACVFAGNGGTATIAAGGTLKFGNSSQHHLRAGPGGSIDIQGPYTIDGSAQTHMGTVGGSINLDDSALGSFAILLTGTPAFPNFFAISIDQGLIVTSPGISFSGAATGTRYFVQAGTIDTQGGGPNFFPGAQPGISGPGGIYL